jgi:hypothetical protein
MHHRTTRKIQRTKREDPAIRMPNPMRDIQEVVSSVQFGEVYVAITRHAGQTVKVSAPSDEMKMFEDNGKALDYLSSLFVKSMSEKRNGKLLLTIDLDKGDLRMITTRKNFSRNY